MARLSKRVLAETFKTDCERFFRFELANNAEKKHIEIDGDKYVLGNRPGVRLMQEAGNKWEIDKYDDLISGYGEENVKFEKRDTVNTRLGVREYKEIPNIIEVLKQDTPPKAIIEGSFSIPESVSQALIEACKRFGIEPSRAIPDIIWIRPYNNETPLIQDYGETEPEFELHIIDVKMAAEASLKHFTEVTFYALALDRYIRENNLIKRYRVSARGLIWPGSHDAYEFKNLLRRFEAEGSEDTTLDALKETLIEVPYEVYEVHVRRFFKDKLIPLLETQPLDVQWHVSSKCQLCQYLPYCEKMADDEDHLSRIPWLNKSQSELIRSQGIKTTTDLASHITTNSELWQNIKNINYQLKADELGIKARCEAIRDNEPKIIIERSTQLMPKWVDMSVYLTIHFDPGSGITFALGAKRVYFKPNRVKGDPPIVNENVFIIDKVEQLNPDTERNRLIEFLDLISTWFYDVDSDNEDIRNIRRSAGERDSAFGKANAHVFFWSPLEVKQLLRMVERHMDHPDVVDRVELLIRLFPPDSILPTDVATYKSQPGTVVKQVIKQLVGLPIAHDYTLLESANNFFPNEKEDGTFFKYYCSFGFWTKLNDQIPFERAYELWKDDVFLTHYKKKDGSDYTALEKNRGVNKYTRDEIYEGIKRSIKTNLNALQHIVMNLREKCPDQLKLKKPPFSAAPPSQMRMPERSRQLVTFNKLNAVTQEIEMINNTSLPIDEKEARFISIRGLINRTPDYSAEIESIREENPHLVDATLYAMEFSKDSRDTKIKEGAFLCCLSNESLDTSIYSFWYTALGLNFYEALDLLNANNINRAERRVSTKINNIFQVEIISLNTIAEIPFVIISISRYNLDMFQLCVNEGLLNLEEPMVIDPVFKDFESQDVEKTMRLIGGKPPKRRR